MLRDSSSVQTAQSELRQKYRAKSARTCNNFKALALGAHQEPPPRKDLELTSVAARLNPNLLDTAKNESLKYFITELCQQQMFYDPELKRTLAAREFFGESRNLEEKYSKLKTLTKVQSEDLHDTKVVMTKTRQSAEKHLGEMSLESPTERAQTMKLESLVINHQQT